MKSICKLIVLSLLIVVTLVFNSGLAYAVPEIVKGDDVSTQAEVHPNYLDTYLKLAPYSSVFIQTKQLSDGSWERKLIVEPSFKGAVTGAASGAAIGSFACTTSGVAAAAAPLCGAVGGVIGGTAGLVFGPADN